VVSIRPASGGDAYVVTAHDVLWLSRAVEAEGSPREIVACALVNAFVLLYRRRVYNTLAEFVRAYSQPINPRWFLGGDLLAKETERLRRLGRESEADAQESAARKREHVHATRTQFGAKTREAVARALASSWRSDITDFAAPSLDATGRGMVPRSDPKPGENRFWTRLPGWGGYVVEGASSGGGAALVALAVGALLAKRLVG
jgi:hypothetical protein